MCLLVRPLEAWACVQDAWLDQCLWTATWAWEPPLSALDLALSHSVSGPVL